MMLCNSSPDGIHSAGVAADVAEVNPFVFRLAGVLEGGGGRALPERGNLTFLPFFNGKTMLFLRSNTHNSSLLLINPWN